MKGLILKDLYTFKKQFWVVIFFCIMYSVPGIMIKNTGMYIPVIAVVIATMLLGTTMSYDESAGWNGYCAALPLKCSEVVKSKYYLGYLFIIPTSMIALVSNIIVERSLNKNVLMDSLLSTIFASASAVIMIAVLLPLLFKFGQEKVKIIPMLIILLVGGIFVTISILYIIDDLISLPISLPSVYTMAIIESIIAVILHFVSIFISIRIYEKKEF